MEPSEGRRLSGLASILNDDHENINRIPTDRPYSSASIISTSVLSPSTYDYPPPYPGRLSNPGLVSPPESRRTSGNEKSIPPPIKTSGNHGFSLPSIQEVTGKSSGPYGSPTSASLPPSAHSMTFSHGQPPHSASRSHLPDHVPYPTYISAIQRPPSPNQYQPVFNSFPRTDERQFTFTEAPRHKVIQPITGTHNPYPAPQFEATGHEHDPRPREGPNGYHRGIPLQQQAYQYGSNHTQMSPAYQVSTHTQPKVERRDSRELTESWKGTKIMENKDPAAAARQGVKRHLDVYDFENNLAEINNASCELQNWSYQFNLIAQEQQRSVGSIPARMPDIGSIEDMIKHQLTISTALERMRHIIQEQASYEQHIRDQGSREYDDSMNMYGEDTKNHSYASESKKRRGRAAPPGRCHSCNRAETPEWRRGPDGARTLCNACGLHYAKLTRKQSAKQSQSSIGSNLRPKTMDDDNPRPM